MLGPDFMKIADAHGLAGFRVTKREEIEDAVNKARQADGTVVIEFQVAQTDSVYPTVPAGADLNAMIRRPIAS
jgi:acetolactate synthase-1/2/3 large subunit